MVQEAIKIDYLKNHQQTIPTLAQWVYDEWHSYDGSLTKEQCERAFLRRLNDDKLPIAFVALKDNAPVGVVSLKDKSDPELSEFPKNSLWLGSLIAKVEGVDEELLKTVSAMGKRLKFEEMYFYLSNPDLVPWYVERGAEVVDKRSLRNHKVTILKMAFPK